MSSPNRNYILVPFDFTEYSYAAGRFAVQLAAVSSWDLVFLHVHQTDDVQDRVKAKIKSTVKRAESKSVSALLDVKDRWTNEYLPRYKQDMKDNNLSAVSCSFVVKEGLPEDQISHYVKKHKPAVIVMGTRSKEKKKEALVGSVTAQVTNYGKLPVFVIPEDSPLKALSEIKHLTFVTNFASITKELVYLSQVMQFLQFFEIKLSLLHLEQHEELHAGHMPNLIKAILDKYENISEVTVDYLHSKSSVSKQLNNLIDENNIDFLIIKSNKRSIFAKLLKLSIAQKMVFHAKTPMLIFQR